VSTLRWNTHGTLNLAFTYEGPSSLGVSSTLLAGFAPEFAAGAIGNANAIFDVDASAPADWEGRMGIASEVHCIFSLFAPTSHELESRSSELLAAMSDSFRLTHRHDGQALPDGYVHFGYPILTWASTRTGVRPQATFS
jgi:hypothetical protein